MVAGLRILVHSAWAALVLVACAGPPPTQPFTGEAPVWPEPPEPERLRYVTAFSHPGDLGIRPSAWERLKGVLVGAAEEGMTRPMAVAATPDGQVIFVADPEARCVHRFDQRRGRYDCLVPGGDQALASPVGLAVGPGGRVVVADSGLGTVFEVAEGEDELRALPLSPPPAQPTGLAVGPDGELFVSSTASHTVRRYDAAGRLLREYGGRGSLPGEMNFPTYLWLDGSSELLVTDTMNFRIQRIDPQNGVLGAFGRAGDATGTLARPKGVAMDRDGNIYVVDGLHHAMHIFDREGRLLLAVGSQGQGPGQFWLPSGVFVTEAGLVFVADAYNRRVQVFRYAGAGS